MNVMITDDGKRYCCLEINSSPHKTQMKSVLSLFSGAGGFDIGFERAGFDNHVCIEIDPDCRETLKYNRPKWHVIDSTKNPITKRNRTAGDIRQISGSEVLSLNYGKPFDCVIGGAPCQPFSNIGKKLGVNDKLNGDLYLEFIRLVLETRPKTFVFENVSGIHQNKHSTIPSEIISTLSEAGYNCVSSLLNAADYGVPQKRLRFFIIGVSKPYNPLLPLPSHFKNYQEYTKLKNGLIGSHDLKYQEWVSLSSAFASLPLNYRERDDYKLMNISNIVKKRMEFIAEGQNFKSVPFEYLPNCWKSGKHLGSDTFGRLKLNEPSVTIRTAAYNPSKGKYIHPTENRGLDTIELAQIQTFPYEWKFKSVSLKPTLVSIGKQIGNAVPVLLAHHIANAIMCSLSYMEAKNDINRFSASDNELMLYTESTAA